MNIHITKTYNIDGRTGIRQDSVLHAGEVLGCREMGLFRFPDETDTDEQLHVRMDGIIASLRPDDHVLLQYPTGVSARYDRFLIEHIRWYTKGKLAIYVQEVASLTEGSGYTMEDELYLLGQADLLIYPSEAMREFYRAHGLPEKPSLIWGWYDCRTDLMIREHKARKMHVLSADLAPGESVFESNVEILGYDEYHLPDMLMKLADGGLGLVWNFDEDEDAINETGGLDLGMFLTAGIPVIVQKGLPCEEFVTRTGVGYAAEDPEEIYRICAALSDEDLQRCYDRVGMVQPLFAAGVYTQERLLEMEIQLNEMR